MEFKDFKIKVQEQFQKMVDNHSMLFLTNVNKDVLWETYLNGFPEGTNEIYKERREYDCSSCKQFIRPYGNIVAIKDNKLISIWDIEIDYPYQEVANKLSKLVKSRAIKDVFVSKLQKLGIDKNRQLLPDGNIITWQHFYFELPKAFVDKSSKSEESIMGSYRDAKNVFKRSLDEISLEAIQTTVELIGQKSIYRGEEHLPAIKKFLKYKKEYLKLKEKEKNNYCWNNFKEAASVSKIRNQAIGTLLVDISEGKELDIAVTAFEKIMAPANYKRPTALITKKMIEQAQEKIKELGFENSLGRRYAVSEDITVNNVLFANRDAKKAMNVFDEMINEVQVNPQKFNKIEEVSIEDFIKNILPNSTNVEVMLENKHSGNLFSLIAPQDKDAPNMLKWHNNFSWAYNGDVTDSIKESVKTRGGKVDGVLRFSISWEDNNDLDAHCIEPGGNLIYFSNMHNYKTSGELDVDIITPSDQNYKDIVENITWSDINKMEEGKYTFLVHNYTSRGGRKGFKAELEYDGQIYSYEYNKPLKQGEKVIVAEIEFSKTNGIKFIKSLESTTASKEIWGLHTNNFQTVSMILNSPNHWDEQGIGNKHYFFILENCKNSGQPRGFFNEFLNEDLREHRKVFEVLGSKMKVEESENQLSGLGFSSTQKNSLIVKVEGTFTRTIKINF